ncbi:MAG: TIGR01777 family protein [Desulfobacula sp.]|nr:TIGR01777 family protein [Desulfobacula sp.]
MHFIKRTKINVPVETLFAWHGKKGAIERLTPPWAPLKMISRNMEGIKKGVKVTFRLKLFNIPMIWKSEHIEYKEDKIFKDRQTKGPFAKWEHTHRFIPEGAASSTMEDKVEFKLPFGVLSRPFYGFAKKKFETMFSYRHRVLKYDLENHAEKTRKLKVLISGASGTIGKALIPLLQTCGHEVVVLVRRKKDLSDHELFWDPYKGILDIERAGHIDAVINLNGVDISKGKWTAKLKKLIIDSRVIPTSLLARKIANMAQKPEVFISASAIGYYGNNTAGKVTEDDEKGSFFISRVCQEWEDAGLDAQKAGIRTIMLRTGVVLTPVGGALAKMILPFKLGMGVILSHGRQFMSWISIDDEISAILFILENNSIQGAVNLTAPKPVTNYEFSKTLAKVFSRKVYFTMPKFIIGLIWGQMGRETILASYRVKPEKLLNNGFKFQHKTLFYALKDMLGR